MTIDVLKIRCYKTVVGGAPAVCSLPLHFKLTRHNSQGQEATRIVKL